MINRENDSHGVVLFFLAIESIVLGMVPSHESLGHLFENEVVTFVIMTVTHGYLLPSFESIKSTCCVLYKGYENG